MPTVPLNCGDMARHVPMTDTELLDWLQARGRVKARQYGNMKDHFQWDWAHGESLRDAIARRIAAERELAATMTDEGR